MISNANVASTVFEMYKIQSNRQNYVLVIYCALALNSSKKSYVNESLAIRYGQAQIGNVAPDADSPRQTGL